LIGWAICSLSPMKIEQELLMSKVYGGHVSMSMMSFLNDLRFAVRSLARTKGLTINCFPCLSAERSYGRINNLEGLRMAGPPSAYVDYSVEVLHHHKLDAGLIYLRI
jgi:hypothetical protein